MPVNSQRSTLASHPSNKIKSIKKVRLYYFDSISIFLQFTESWQDEDFGKGLKDYMLI